MENLCTLVTHEQTQSMMAEAYRALRTNIQFSKVDGKLKTIMFTSSGPGEGKSTTAANMAVVLAQSGKRVILVDCDLRRPMLHRIFRKENTGLTNALVYNTSAVLLLQDTYVEGLRLLTSGPIPPNPSELLGSDKMLETLHRLEAEADFVVIDAPPAVAVTDACVLSSRVDGVVLVIAAGIAHREMAQKAKDLLTNAKGRILGAVVNRAEIEKGHSYYYYYYGNETQKAANS